MTSVPPASISSLLSCPANPPPFFKHKSESVSMILAPRSYQPTRSTGSQDRFRENFTIICKRGIKPFPEVCLTCLPGKIQENKLYQSCSLYSTKRTHLAPFRSCLTFCICFHGTAFSCSISPSLFLSVCPRFTYLLVIFQIHQFLCTQPPLP